jgi:hypothetical protein
LRTIAQTNDISPSDSDQLRELVRRYTLEAIRSNMKLSQQGITNYQCNWFGGEKNMPLNPPMIHVIKNSKSLSLTDKEELFRKLKK